MNNINSHLISLILLLVAPIVNADSYKDDFGKATYDSCNSKNYYNDSFLNGYIMGYANSFRYLMRDMGLKIENIPDTKRICDFYVSKYTSKNRNSLLLNLSIENDVLNANGYEYKNFDELKNKVFKK